MTRFPILLPVLLAGLLSLTPATAQEAAGELPEVPAPDLSGAAPPVRDALTQARSAMIDLMANTEEPITLANAWLALGDAYFAHDYLAQAGAAWRQVEALQPARSDLHYRLGVLATLEGNAAAAIDRFDSALEMGFPDVLVPGRIRRGLARLEQGETAAARRDFETALRLAPDAPAALGGLGRVALADGRPEEAVDLLTRALNLDPAGTRLYAPLGQALRDLGRVDEARTALERAGEGEPIIDDPIMLGIQQLSRSPQFYLEAGLAQAERGDFQAATQMLSRGATLAPDDPAVVGAYARVLARDGQYELALGALRQLRELGTMGAEDWVLLGQVEALTGSIEQALGAYAGALTLEPGMPGALEGQARVWLHREEFDRAAAQFGELAASAGDSARQARMLYWQGMTRLASGNCGEALGPMQAALEASSSRDSALLSALARMRASCLDASDAELDEARSWAEQIYDARPGLASAETLAMVYAAIGRDTDAVDLQAQAIFEALKVGEVERRGDLQANMRRYEAGQPAERPLAPDDPRFRFD